jgi:hypothetical protein
MLFLPEVARETFLLFVADAQGRTSLRDYSAGWARKLATAPGFEEAMRRTEEGRTRFALSDIRRKEDLPFWQAVTQEHNRRLPVRTVSETTAARRQDMPVANAQHREHKGTGRAARGSQRQLQDYVNLYTQELNQAILSQLPEALRDRSIRWPSPLAEEEYREYQDGEFLQRLGLGSFSKQLAEFWPRGGPCWDALGQIEPRQGGELPIALLVEAKSHVPEMRSQGCQASERSFAMIQRALGEAKQWSKAAPEADWTGPLYQAANRIAHLYFFRQRIGHPCFLIHLYFVDDPYRPTSQAEWDQALDAAHQELGLNTPVSGLVEVFLPGKTTSEAASNPPEMDYTGRARSLDSSTMLRRLPVKSFVPMQNISPMNRFATWRDRWQRLAVFDGAHLPDPDRSLEQLLALWQEPIPGKWQREPGKDTDKWKASPYRRTDLAAPRAGEHTMERTILVDHRVKVNLLGDPLLHGINAVPLAADFPDHGRRANVEADMLLLSRTATGYRLALCELKDGADNAWFAAVELLRQMRLFLSGPSAQSLMTELGHLPADAANVTMTGLVVAPSGYYAARGKKGNAVALAHTLLRRMRQHHNVDVHLAIWNPADNSIQEHLGARV